MSRKSPLVSWIVALVVMVLIVLGGIYLFRHATPRQPAPASASTAAVASSSGANASSIEHPISQAGVPAESSTTKLPALADSDESVLVSLEALAPGAGAVLMKQQLVNRFVATVDALPRASWGNRLLPAHPPEGAFPVTTADGHTVIGADNTARYGRYVQMLEQVDPKAAVAWYVHAYPLFQSAYEKLGYPKGYFNDRLIQAIDNLLAAPQPSAPIEVVKSKGTYRFADSRLQSLSAGQKLMLRMGPANESKVKARLHAIRAALTGAQLPTPASSVVPASSASAAQE